VSLPNERGADAGCAEVDVLLNVLKNFVRRRGAAATAPAVQPPPSLERALALQASGQVDAAEAVYRRLLDEEPDHADAAHLLGVLLHRADRSAEAIHWLERAVALRPTQAEAALHLASAYQGANLLAEAEQGYRACIAHAPELVPAHVSLGILLKQQGRLAESRTVLETALRLQPQAAEVWHNLGNLQRDLGDDAGACSSFERALDLDPGFLEARYSRALALLGQGDFARGWEEHEVRLALPRRAADLRPFAHPRWQGEARAGTTLLVWGEQGIGDELLHASMYRDLIDAGARCVFECSAKLVPLFRQSFPEATVVPRTQPPHPATMAGIDFQIPAGSLGAYLRPALDRFPRRRDYLCAHPARLAHWRERLDRLGPGLRIGFCWRSSDPRGERALACTRLEQWDALLRTPDVHWICLQADDCQGELDAARARQPVPLHRFDIDHFNDLAEVSALTAALDLVISAPTAVSIHAAALGVDVWQLTYGADWQTHGTASVPWHPGMQRYLRRWDEPWSVVLDRVAAALSARTSRGS
jgi:tetratricopeptide (TPR) repeat protein